LIISHDYKFIFIKTNKTAGTSVEIALSKFCGPDDIVTPISGNDEAQRKEMGYTGAQNYQAERRLLPRRISSLLGMSEKKAFFNHISAGRIRAQIPRETWDSYFKFCIERNPWDRAISGYFWKNRKEPRQPLIEWLKNGGHKVLQERGRDLYLIDGDIAVDRVIRYENLSDELEEIRLNLGLPEPLELPNAKSSSRKGARDYREIFGEEERRIVERDFAFEIATFGYSF
jgi:hypothetical protein